jgi:hypothetical protein
MFENQIIMDDVVVDNNNNCYIRPVWDNSARQQFVDSLDPVSILELNNELVDIYGAKNYSDACSNNITEKVSQILYQVLIDEIYYWKLRITNQRVQIYVVIEI